MGDQRKLGIRHVLTSQRVRTYHVTMVRETHAQSMSGLPLAGAGSAERISAGQSVEIITLGARVAECLAAENSSALAGEFVAARAWAAQNRAMFR